MFVRGEQRIGRSAHGLRDRLPSGLGGGPCLFRGRSRDFTRVPQTLAALTDGLERIAMPVTNGARLLGQAPRLLSCLAVGFGQQAVLFGPTPLVLGFPAVGFGCGSRTFGLLLPVGPSLIVRHVVLLIDLARVSATIMNGISGAVCTLLHTRAARRSAECGSALSRMAVQYGTSRPNSRKLFSAAMMANTDRSEFKRLMLQIERDLLAQAFLRERLTTAGHTVAGHRQELRTVKARLTRTGRASKAPARA